MPKWWSEVPLARSLEVMADGATLVWIVGWVRVGWWLYDLVARFAGAGVVIREAGTGLQAAGAQIAEVLGRVPVIGEASGLGVRLAFATAAVPFIGVGSELARFVVVVASLIALIVAGVFITLWLQRYLPWRLHRLRQLQAAHQAIRVAPRLDDAEIERLLAARAIHRLSYDELLQQSSDPFGDWVAGRYDRLARAELASVGLRPRPRKMGNGRQ